MAAAQLKLRVWLKLLCGLVFVFGVVVPCILLIMAGTNFDTAHVPLQHQSVASKSHERKPLDYADVPDSAGALKFQISELENIRLSVRNELRVMDRDRQRLAGEVESARQALAVLKKDIEKAKIELQNTRSKLSRAVRQVKRASDEPPTISSAGPVVVVSLPASSQSKVQPLPQAVAVDGKQRVFCTQEACLDHSRCPLHKAFLVYVYNENRPYSSLFPLRDNQVLKGFLTRLREVGTLTSDPELACLFVVVVGPLLQPLSQSLLEERLHSLPTWTASQAANHLLIDIPYQGVATPLRGIDIGRAILAHGLAQQWDILLPPVTRDDDKPLWQGLPLHLPAKRQNLVYFEGHQSQKESLSDLTAADLDSITSALAGRVQDKLFIRTSCPSVSEQVFPGEWALCGSPEERHSHLSLTTFSLVLGSGSGLNGPTTYTRLVEALRYGAIPVVIGVGRLPLETVINWNLAVVTIPTSQVGQLHLLLKSYTDEKILSFRRQGRYLWETFFSSPGRMLDSVISLLRSWFNHPPPVVLDYSEVTRLVSIPGGNRQVPSPIFQYNFTTYTSEFWNSPPGPFYMYPSTPFQPSPVSGLRYVGLDSAHIQGLPQHIIDAGGITGPYFEDYLLGNLPEEQFTVVMLTYERNSVLLQALDRLSDLDSLSKVIVMWNNPSPPSADMPWPDIGVPLEVSEATTVYILEDQCTSAIGFISTRLSVLAETVSTIDFCHFP